MDFMGHLVGQLAARADEMSEALSSGKAGSYEEYKRIVGHIAGLREAIEIAKNTHTKMVMEEDE